MAWWERPTADRAAIAAASPLTEHGCLACGHAHRASQARRVPERYCSDCTCAEYAVPPSQRGRFERYTSRYWSAPL